MYAQSAKDLGVVVVVSRGREGGEGVQIASLARVKYKGHPSMLKLKACYDRTIKVNVIQQGQ